MEKVRQCYEFLQLDEAIASRVVFVVISGSGGWVETLLEPAKQLKKGKKEIDHMSIGS